MARRFLRLPTSDYQLLESRAFTYFVYENGQWKHPFQEGTLRYLDGEINPDDVNDYICEIDDKIEFLATIDNDVAALLTAEITEEEYDTLWNLWRNNA